MTPSTIPDITDAEHWMVSTTIAERWSNKKIDIEMADVEIRMHPDDRVLSLCPALYWQVDNTSFVIVKTGERNYRCQFYYRGYQQYGTGKTEFDDIADCITTLLQVHSDKETELSMEQH